MKLVINRCYGGFGLSDLAIEKYAELKGLILSKTEYGFLHTGTEKFFHIHDIKRNDPALIQIIEELKEKANGMNSKLKIIENVHKNISKNLSLNFFIHTVNHVGCS